MEGIVLPLFGRGVNIDIVYLLLAVPILLFLKTSFFIVKQKQAAVVETLGKFDKISEAGLNIKWPYPISKVVDKVNLQIMQLSPDVVVKSSDNAFLTIPVKVQLKIIDKKMKEAFYELDDPTKQIQSYVVNQIRSMSSQLTMDELFSGNNSFDAEVKTNLNATFYTYGYEIIDLLIDDPQPSAELKSAFDKVLAAKREKDASQNQADALKIKMIGEAVAEKESLLLKGEAFVLYRNTISAGNKLALDIMLGRKVKSESIEKYEDEIIENGEIKKVQLEKVNVTYVDNQNYNKNDSNISELDILKFFEGIDHREALRSVGKGKGNVIISTDSPSLSKDSDNLAKIMGIIQSKTESEKL